MLPKKPTLSQDGEAGYDTWVDSEGMASELSELRALVASGSPIVVFETSDEERVVALLSTLASEEAMPLLTWRAHRGLATHDAGALPIVGTEDPQKALAFIEEANREAIYHLRGIAPSLSEGAAISRMKEVYRRLSKHRGVVVLSGAEVVLPPDVEALVNRVSLGPLSDRAMRDLIQETLSEMRARRPVAMKLTPDELGIMLRELRGLSTYDIRRIVSKAIASDGALSVEDLAYVAEEKKKAMQRTGILEPVPSSKRFSDVAGLSVLKGWIQRRAPAFVDPKRAESFGLRPPRGILLLGVQGCGKSLGAKAIAGEFGVPLVRLDPGRLYQKYVGETEKALHRALSVVDGVAPVVLWVDELEKAFAPSEQGDGGVSSRIFGSLLSWMQEHKSAVFVVGTANDVSRLPPELLRKGRFDEIFFVDLPSEAGRSELLSLFLRVSGRDPTAFPLREMSAELSGFSGAELEELVQAALYRAFSEGRELLAEDLRAEARATIPLSVTMAERISELRLWASARAVFADGPPSTSE